MKQMRLEVISGSPYRFKFSLDGMVIPASSVIIMHRADSDHGVVKVANKDADLHFKFYKVEHLRNGELLFHIRETE